MTYQYHCIFLLVYRIFISFVRFIDRSIIAKLSFIGIGIGIATGKATEAISRQPEASGKIQTNLLLGAALAEGTAIFGFVVALLIILFLG